MKRTIVLALAVCMVACATGTIWADGHEKDRPEPGRHFEPMRLFERLDVDKEGTISLEKLPEKMPERLKEMLVQADADGDKRVTREEFKAAVEAARAHFAERRKEATEREERGKRGKGCPSDRGRKDGRPHRSAPEMGGRPMPDLKSLFSRMDRDESGELSEEEFTEGMRRLREHMARRHAHAHPPMGPHMRPPMGPPSERRPGPSWHRGPGRPPRGPADAGPRGRSKDDEVEKEEPADEEPAKEA